MPSRKRLFTLLIIAFIKSLFLYSTTDINYIKHVQTILEKFSKISQTILLNLLGITATATMLYWIFMFYQNVVISTSIGNIIIYSIALIVISMLVYNLVIQTTAYKDSPLFQLIFNAIFYIPCILSNFYDLFINNLLPDKFSFSKDFNSTKPGTFILIIALILLIVGIFVYPLFENKVILQDGELLLNKPVNTNIETVIGKYKNLYIPSDNFATDTHFKAGDKVMQNGNNTVCGILNDGIVGTIDSISQDGNTITIRQDDYIKDIATKLKDTNDNLCTNIIYNYNKSDIKLVAENIQNELNSNLNDGNLNLTAFYDFRFSI